MFDSKLHHNIGKLNFLNMCGHGFKILHLFATYNKEGKKERENPRCRVTPNRFTQMGFELLG